MRKITSGLFISLDGVVEAPETWHFPYFNDEMGNVVQAGMANSDTMLLGRVTYEEFAGFWPNQPGDDPFAGHMNGTPKLVVSKTLQQADWANSTLINGDVYGRLREIKAQDGKDISIVGSPSLVRSLLQEGLLDELSLLIHPIVVGNGKRLFEPGMTQVPLRLVESTMFSTGVVWSVYHPAASADAA